MLGVPLKGATAAGWRFMAMATVAAVVIALIIAMMFPITFHQALALPAGVLFGLFAHECGVSARTHRWRAVLLLIVFTAVLYSLTAIAALAL